MENFSPRKDIDFPATEMLSLPREKMLHVFCTWMGCFALVFFMTLFPAWGLMVILTGLLIGWGTRVIR